MKTIGCQNCGSKITSPYCKNCGEKKFDIHNLSIIALIRHIFISITDIDGKVFTSFKLLFLKPGQLTLDYLTGVRKYRLYPFQLFIYINILYFLLVSFTQQNTFSTPLAVHLKAENFIHVDIAKSLINDRLLLTSESFEDYTFKFDKRIESYSKILIFTMIPIFSMLVLIIFYRHKYIGIKSIIYATHFLSIALAIMIVVTIIMYLLSLVFYYFFENFPIQIFSNDSVFSGSILGWLLVYLFFSIRRIFHGSISINILQSLVLVVAFYYSIIIYRALLFFITFYSIP